MCGYMLMCMHLELRGQAPMSFIPQALSILILDRVSNWPTIPQVD